jgi:transcriptional regulator with XRE-family HTH domain
LIVQLNRHALRVIRQRSGLTVSALARRAGVSQPHLSNIERGRRQPSPELIGRLAGALRVPIVALLAELDDEPEPASTVFIRARSSPGWSCCRGRPGSAQQQGKPMQHSNNRPPDSAPTESGASHPWPDVQTPGGSMPASRVRRRAGLAVVGLASAGAVLAAMTPAQAETYYTGQCSQSTSMLGQTYYRTFQARIVGGIESGTGKYIWNHYDYKYTIDLHLSSGASSNEQVSFTSGYSDGLSNPWDSPDNHGSSGDWIGEGNWKGAKSYWGYTKVKFYAAFDIPGTPDTHCNSYTAIV